MPFANDPKRTVTGPPARFAIPATASQSECERLATTLAIRLARISVLEITQCAELGLSDCPGSFAKPRRK